MNEHNYRDILKIEFESRKARNQYYSLRAFAQALGMGSGALSEILNGKRNLGANKAAFIVDKLKLDQLEKDIFLNSTKMKKSTITNNIPKEKPERNLTLELFEFVSSSVCSTILAGADLDDFKFDPKWIAKKFNFGVEEVEKAISLMGKIGLIDTIAGKQKINADFIISPDGISSRAIKNYHHFMLDKASDALEEQDVNKRDISGISFAMDKSNITKLKKDILNFQKRMIKKYSQGEKDEVYHLEMALFSLTKEDQ